MSQPSPRPPELEFQTYGSRRCYSEFHADLDLITGYLVADESFDPASWNAALLRGANDQLWRLRDDSDVNYRLPGIGRMYASWYHLRRVRGAFELLRQRVDPSNPITVLDLGCGTGAAAWALAMLGIPARYIGIDLSEPMLTWGRGLWDEFRREFSMLDTVRVDWVRGGALNLLCNGELGDRADLVLMPFLFDDRFAKGSQAYPRDWGACLRHLGASSLIAWSSPRKIDRHADLLRRAVGARPCRLNPEFSIDRPACPYLTEARQTIHTRLGHFLRDSVPVSVGVEDTVGLEFYLRPGSQSARALSRAAASLDLTSAELIAVCRELDFEDADRFTMATALSLGQIESIHAHLGRRFKEKEYAR